MFNRLHDARLLQLCSMQSHWIEGRSSPASSDRTRKRRIYCTILRTYIWLTKVTSLASNRLQDGDAHIHEQPGCPDYLVVDHASSLTLRSCGKNLLVVPPVQDAIRRQSISRRFSSDIERPTNAHTVGRYSKASSGNNWKHLFNIAYITNQHGLCRRLWLAVSTRPIF